MYIFLAMIADCGIKKIHWFSMMLLIRKLLVELNTHSNNISIEIFVQDYVH